MALIDTGLRKFTDGGAHSLLQGTDSSGVPRNVRVDTVTNSMMTIDHGHHEVHDGDAYRYADSVTLGAAAIQDYLLTVADTTSWPHFTFSVDGTAITTVEVFRATNKVGTTLQATFNANENSTNTAGLTIHKAVSGGTTDGTRLFVYSSGTASGSSKSDGAGVYGTERILKQNTKYIIRITSGTTGNLCNFRAEWYEHTSLT